MQVYYGIAGFGIHTELSKDFGNLASHADVLDVTFVGEETRDETLRTSAWEAIGNLAMEPFFQKREYFMSLLLVS